MTVRVLSPPAPEVDRDGKVWITRGGGAVWVR